MEVGPRDGLQIEKRILTTDEKIGLIEALERAGLSEIEVGSFVNPRAVPQMADTPDVFERLSPKSGVKYRALWLSTKGLERAAAIKTVALNGMLHLTASETFVKRNTNRTIEETFNDLPSWIEIYKAHSVPVDTLGIMAAFGCNFEGDVSPDLVIGMVKRAMDILASHGCALKTLSLSDTMGWAVPGRIKALVGKVRDRWPDLSIKLHLHDTRGTAMANAMAGMEMGVSQFDSSIAGLGGCPFAGHKGAAGNICTEDLAFMCEEMGIETGLDMEALIDAAVLAEQLIDRPCPGKIMKSGLLKRLP
jgi:hydroxymethylglutaryl-CoA lyase